MDWPFLLSAFMSDSSKFDPAVSSWEWLFSAQLITWVLESFTIKECSWGSGKSNCSVASILSLRNHHDLCYPGFLAIFWQWNCALLSLFTCLMGRRRTWRQRRSELASQWLIPIGYTLLYLGIWLDKMLIEWSGREMQVQQQPRKQRRWWPDFRRAYIDR